MMSTKTNSVEHPQSFTLAFLDLATPEHRQHYERLLDGVSRISQTMRQNTTTAL